MLPKPEIKKVSINVEKDKWEDFKKIAKLNQSDTNKEIRKFMDKYLADNAQLIMRIRG